MSEHVDVLIVGAGISGIGGAYHLTQQCPGTSFVILEAQESFGGTWSPTAIPASAPTATCYTFGYRFKPWTGPPIATADEILQYLGEVIDENDLDRHIRYQPPDRRAQLVERRQPLDHRCDAHRHRRGGPLHRRLPLDVPGLLPPRRGLHAGVAGDGRLHGPIVHPQTWPEDLDYTASGSW